jgi:hypothetical protein
MIRNLQQSLAKRLYVNTNHDLANTILLAGTGRSGTTWLSNIVNHGNEYRYIFEPFVPQYTYEWRNFHYKQYLNPDGGDKHAVAAAKTILSGQIRNVWVDKFNNKIICNRRLIKDIRVNFMLKWLHNNFPQIPIIFMLRHPCAVASSRIQLNWQLDIDEILDQSALITDYFADTLNVIDDTKDIFLRNICLWCMENYVPLQQFKQKEVYILFYEHLCVAPEREISRLFSWLEQAHPESISNVVQKPSQVTEKHSAIRTGENLVKQWTRHISDEQATNAIRLLRKFNLDYLYDETPLPLLKESFTSEITAT